MVRLDYARTHRRADFRITVPLYSSSVSSDGYVVPTQRWALAEDVDLVQIDEAESSRLERGGLPFTKLRLEMFDKSPRAEDYWTLLEPVKGAHEHEEIGRRLQHVLNVHSLAVRVPFRAMAANVDQFTGSCWQRVGSLQADSLPLRRDGRYSSMPVSRISTWSSLLEHWPFGRKKLDLTLSLYAASVDARWEHRYRESLLAAATATEVLLSTETQELSHKVSQRAAQLVSPGASGFATFRLMKDLYGVRSKVIHSGKQFDTDACTTWQQFLMAALPRAAAYGASDTDLIEDLDKAAFMRSKRLQRIDGSGWWSYCDFAVCTGVGAGGMPCGL